MYTDVYLFVEVHSTQFGCFHSLIVGYDLCMFGDILVDLKVQ